MLEHPPYSPDGTVAWLEACLDGRAPLSRVLLRRLLKLARWGATSSQEGRAANIRARDDYWRSVVDDCEQLPGIKGRRHAVRMAAPLLGANDNTLRGVAGPSPSWIKERKI